MSMRYMPKLFCEFYELYMNLLILKVLYARIILGIYYAIL
ncbi:Uncharacterised protein [uncultured Blautia sp.]|nr:Uncharacterised protein [uncultured Blautia sp.]